MEFRNTEELINIINQELGTFCREFQSARKEYLGLSRMASHTKIFTFHDNTRDWAINHGAGREIQYHVTFRDGHVGYGIGFNTQYVPFHTEMTSVEYIQPFIDAFFSDPLIKSNLINQGFNYTYGDESRLKNMIDNTYVLIGKEIPVNSEGGLNSMTDESFRQMIEDLQGVMFDTYKKVFELKSNFEITNAMIDDIIEVLELKKQIILQGPPGTGKTYSAKDMAEKLITGSVSADKTLQKEILEASEQFAMVQFHPSYTYEDFVRGIIARPIGTQIEYVAEDKVLVEFANKARVNLNEQSMSPTNLTRRQWVNDEMVRFVDHVQVSMESNGGEHIINETVFICEIINTGFKYTGRNVDTQQIWTAAPRTMKFQDIIQGYLADAQSRAEYQALDSISGLANQHASYYYRMVEQFREFIGDHIPEFDEVITPVKKNYILIIDEINRANLPSVLGELIYALEYRNEKVASMYAVDGDNSIVIPENLLIIGTMNTADRSVGNIDYAIKRRFSFVDMLPDQSVIISEKGKALFTKVSELFGRDFRATDFEKKDIQLGHSYFIAANDEELKLKLKYEIVPILYEYVKDGLLLDNAKEFITNEIKAFEI